MSKNHILSLYITNYTFIFKLTNSSASLNSKTATGNSFRYGMNLQPYEFILTTSNYFNKIISIIKLSYYSKIYLNDKKLKPSDTSVTNIKSSIFTYNYYKLGKKLKFLLKFNKIMTLY